MDTFLYPVCVGYENTIHTIKATSLSDAESRIIDSYMETCELAEDSSWKEFVESMSVNYSTEIGHPTDIYYYTDF